LACGQLILRKISIIGATLCQILTVKCIKFAVRWGSTLDPVVGAYSAPPDPLVVLKGTVSKTRKGRGGNGKVKVKGREGERRWRGDLAHPKIVAWRHLWSPMD